MIKKPNYRRPNRYNAARDANAAAVRLSSSSKQSETPRWSLPVLTTVKWVVAAAVIAYIVQTLIIHGSP